MEVQTSTFQRRTVGRGVNEDTFEDYLRWVRRFTDWADDTGYTAINVGALIEFDEALMDPPAPGVESRDTPYAYRTRAKALSAVKKWAEVVKDEPIETDVDDIVMGEPADFDPYIYTREQVRSVHEDDCDVAGCRTARALGYDAIMRAAEVASVRPEDVDLDNRTVYVRGAKGSESRHIAIGDDVWRLVEEQYRRVQDRFASPARLFYDSSGQNAWSPNSWSKHFSRNHAPGVPGEETGFHSFARHTAITRRLEGDDSFGDVYLRARHSNPQMTSRYVGVAGVQQPDDDLFQQ